MIESIKRWKWEILVILFIVGAVFFASKAGYEQHIHPIKVKVVADYSRRYGAPVSVTEFTHEGSTCFWVDGRIPGIYGLALPSAAPAYIFNAGGELVDWCSAPGGTPSFDAKWPKQAAKPVAPLDFVARFR